MNAGICWTSISFSIFVLISFSALFLISPFLRAARSPIVVVLVARRQVGLLGLLLLGRLGDYWPYYDLRCFTILWLWWFEPCNIPDKGCLIILIPRHSNIPWELVFCSNPWWFGSGECFVMFSVLTTNLPHNRGLGHNLGVIKRSNALTLLGGTFDFGRHISFLDAHNRETTIVGGI